MPPRATKTGARIILIKIGLGSDVTKCTVSIVAHHEIRRAILCVIVRRGIFVLVCALIEGIKTEVDIEPTVAVIIGNGGAGKSSLRLVPKQKCVRFLSEFASALVQEQHR